MKPVRVELAHRANYGVRRGKIEWIVICLLYTSPSPRD